MPDEAPSETTPPSGNSGEAGDLTVRAAVVRLLHPVFVTILIILISVFVLMGRSVFGTDSDVLARMADHEFARGVITYLFAVTTIGTAIVLVLGALTGALAHEQAYTRGKDILALLLGVFGTIVGFYFGSEAHAGNQAIAELSVTPPLASTTVAAPGDSVRVTAFVSGGSPPYSFGVALGQSDLSYNKGVDANGWILYHQVIPRDSSAIPLTVRLGVKDRTGGTQIRELVINVRGPPGRP